jgi:hypothetical protein
VTSGADIITGRQIRFLADENLRAAIVDGLRRRQPMIDIVTAEEILLLWEASEPEEWRNRVTYLPL